ncbi:TetR/AcrR family transcriptional regulator [Rhizobium paknamense]|uniref:AcrR family transcriptional regulator n=1 Tax=Rhizobium paknamense TaxID=1206817 RepID=A0ABU0IFY6_9HYPH|nr:TetR/AcrR family transcriptional regulator [Rhizobium paknamense]MDQ0456114.1 AcrR family transcriptional regulator [Rhizobium paknamense]
MAEKTKPTRAEQKALRPQQIMDAAFVEFVKNGFSATRVEDIAARIGMTKGTVYVYFATKELLFEAVVDHISQPFKEVLPRLDGLTGRYEKKLKDAIRLFYSDVMADDRARELIRFTISEASRFPDLIDRNHETYIEPVVSRIRAIIEGGVQAGEFRDGPAARFVEVVCGPALMMIFWRVLFEDRRTLDQEGFMAAHIDMVVNGLLKH